MKVFIVHDNPYNAGNPYIYTLIDSISVVHKDVEWGWGDQSFWSEDVFAYDIIHFQWPQVLMSGDKEHTFDDLRQHLNEIHKRGIKIVATCHDARPHYTQGADGAMAFPIVYEACDLMFHLGEASLEYFKSVYKQAQHKLLPHQVFDTVYTQIPTREVARKRLNLALDKKYILCLGAFRAAEEQQLVNDVIKGLHNKDVYIIAPAYKCLPTKRMFLDFRGALLFQYYKNVKHIIMTGKDWTPVTDEELPFYYAAVDMCLVHRKKILNSGNAILPLMMKRLVVGPHINNVGWLLDKCGYPTFDVTNTQSLVDCVRKGLEMADSELVEKNYIMCMKEFSTAVVAEKMYQHYTDLLNNIK